jgi:hypothetical protein
MGGAAERGGRVLALRGEVPMALPPRDFSTIGPREGARFPDLVLQDQSGIPVDLHAARRGRPALVVFYRSADW